MTTRVHKIPPLDGPYALTSLARMETSGGGLVECGVVRFGRGTRSPAQGFHTNSRHEIAMVLRGRVLVETASTQFEVGPGEYIIGSAGEPHATTGLEDAELFFVLVDPTRNLG